MNRSPSMGSTSSDLGPGSDGRTSDHPATPSRRQATPVAGRRSAGDQDIERATRAMPLPQARRSVDGRYAVPLAV